MIEYSFPTGPKPCPLWHQEGSSLLSSSLIMQVCASHGSKLRSQRQLYSPLACIFCHQRALLSLPLLCNLYGSLLDKTNPGNKQEQGKRVRVWGPQRNRRLGTVRNLYKGFPFRCFNLACFHKTIKGGTLWFGKGGTDIFKDIYIEANALLFPGFCTR